MAYIKQADIKTLKEVLETAQMRHCNFEQMFGGTPATGSQLPKDESEVTEFIKVRTELWRRTWIIGMLREVLENIKSA